MLISRDITARFQEVLPQYPVLALTGPRQSGKTTLLRNLLPQYQYVSLEEPFQREFAQNDPRGFLDKYSRYVIFDEVQRVPDLFSYIQTKTDNDRIMGQYILSGSQNFLLLEQITQSLAGRVSLFKLLPLSHAELAAHSPAQMHKRPSEAIFWGGYPALYDRGIGHFDFFSDYVETYVERDVRNLLRVQDLTAFRNFVRLCAGRIGTPLNLHSLAVDCGISNPTAKAWMSLLESSYIVYLLPPYFQNFNKRIIKSSKLYFYDTGLACYLLGLTAPEQVEGFYMRGGLFENMVILELLKNRMNRKAPANFYFWQDSNGIEVDLLLEAEGRTNLFEMKYSQTPHAEFSKGITSFRKNTPQLSGDNTIIYAGDIEQLRSDFSLLGWESVKDL